MQRAVLETVEAPFEPSSTGRATNARSALGTHSAAAPLASASISRAAVSAWEVGAKPGWTTIKWRPNTHLQFRTFFVGERVTLADVCLFSALYYPLKFVMDKKYRKDQLK